MLAKTQAIALRIHPFSRTSHIVAWLSPEWGRLQTVIKGACRRNSLFLGQYELGSTTELVFYTRERDGLHIARECSLETARTNLRTDWRAYIAAAWALELVARTVTAPGAGQDIFAGLNALLGSLTARTAPWLLMEFELQLLDRLGFRPKLDRCARCGKRLESGVPTLISPRDGGTICARPPDPATPPDILALLRRLHGAWRPEPAATWQPAIPRGLTASPNQLLACARNIGNILTYHLDTPPDPRTMTYRLLIQGFRTTGPI